MGQNNCMDPGFPRPPILPSEEYVCVDVYTVRTGDTLYSISQKYGVSVAILMDANRILNPYNLRLGQRICIPGKKTGGGKPSHDPCEWEPVRCEPEEPVMPVPMPMPAPAPAPMPRPAPAPAPMPRPAPAPAPMPRPVCEGILHTIKAGDTFYMMSKQYNILIEDILSANPGVDPYNLQIGQEVCIPIHLALPEERRPGCRGIIHVVQSGDTLYMLAKQYKLTLDEIIAANPGIDCHMLRIGMELCIPTPNRPGGTPLRTPMQPTPSMPSMPFMPSVPTMPSIPTTPMPTMPSMPMPSMPMPTMPSMPMPTIPSMPSTPMPNIPSMPSAPAPGETPACEGFMHTIRTGDTLYMLARRYQITLDELMRANPEFDPYDLRIGMQICIPVSNNLEEGSQAQSAWGSSEDTDGHNNTEYKIYKTQQGDTVTRILDRYKITFAALQSSNPSVDFTEQLADMPICIPDEDLFHTCPMSGAYVVKSGDSLNSISKKLLVISDRLLIANPMLTTDDFSIPGTKVCIPN